MAPTASVTRVDRSSCSSQMKCNGAMGRIATNSSSSSSSSSSNSSCSDKMIKEYRLTLQRRCQKSYGWDLSLATRVFNSYCQFLELKITMEDWDDTIITPSFLIHQMWSAHILDTKHYVEYCLSATSANGGHYIHHNEESTLDTTLPCEVVAEDYTTRKQCRIRTTQAALKIRFEKWIDHMVWDVMAPNRANAVSKKIKPFSSLTLNENNTNPDKPSPQRTTRRKRQRRSSTLSLLSSQSKNMDCNGTGAREDVIITIWIDADYQNQQRSFQLKLPSRQKTQLSYIYKQCGHRMNVNNCGDLLLSYEDKEGNSYYRHRTVKRHGGYLDIDCIENGQSRLICSYNPKPITVAIVGKETDNHLERSSLFELMGRSTKIEQLYDNYSTKNNLPKGSFELRYQGRKLYPGNTPRSLQWFGHIDLSCHSIPIPTDTNDDDGSIVSESVSISTGSTIDEDGNEEHYSLSVADTDNDDDTRSLVTVLVRYQTGQESSYEVCPTCSMDRIFTAQARTLGFDVADLRFLLDGERIKPDQNVATLQLMEGDVIDCMLGGSRALK